MPEPSFEKDRLLKILTLIKTIYEEHNVLLPDQIRALHEQLDPTIFEDEDEFDFDFDFDFVDASITTNNNNINEEKIIYDTVYRILTFYGPGVEVNYANLNELLKELLGKNKQERFCFIEKMLAAQPTELGHLFAQSLFCICASLNNHHHEYQSIHDLESAIFLYIMTVKMDTPPQGSLLEQLIEDKWASILLHAVTNPYAKGWQEQQNARSIPSLIKIAHKARDNNIGDGSVLPAFEAAIHSVLNQCITKLNDASSREKEEFGKLLDDLYRASGDPKRLETTLFRDSLRKLFELHTVDSDILEELDIKAKYGCSFSWGAARVLQFCCSARETVGEKMAKTLHAVATTVNTQVMGAQQRLVNRG